MYYADEVIIQFSLKIIEVSEILKYALKSQLKYEMPYSYFNIKPHTPILIVSYLKFAVIA